MPSLLLTLFLVSALVNYVSSLLILRELAASGVKVGFYEIRWHIHKHLKTYMHMTRERTGAVGLPCYLYLASLLSLVGSFLLLVMALGKS